MEIETHVIAAPPPAREFDDEIDLLDLLIALAKRKRMIVGVTVASAIIAAIVSLLLPNWYTATTKILPPQQTQSAASVMVSQLAGNGLGPLAAVAGKDLGLKNPNDIYIGILNSRTIADSLIAQFDLMHVYRDKRASDTRKDLAKYSDILSEKEGLISISVEDKDPKRAAALANAYVVELRDLTKHLAVTEAGQRRLFFQEQVQQAKDDLARAEIALKDTEQKTGMIQLDGQARAVIEAVGGLRAQIAAKEVQLQAMSSFATDQNPDVLMAQRELAGLRVQLSKLETQSPGQSDPLLASGKVPAAGLEYARSLRDVKYYETVFELLAKQYEAAKLDEARESAVIQVLDPATVPDKKSWPHRALLFISISVLGALMAISSAFALHSTDRVKLNPRNAPRIKKLKLYLFDLNHLHSK